MMRSGMELTALGMVFSGDCASPAVTPMISVPPKANMTTAKESTRPSAPFAKKPPWAQRFDTPTWPSPLPRPKAITRTPTRIMATMATIFTRESQNSSSPKSRTLTRLSAPTSRTAASTQIQRGTSGNQKPM